MTSSLVVTVFAVAVGDAVGDANVIVVGDMVLIDGDVVAVVVVNDFGWSVDCGIDFDFGFSCCTCCCCSVTGFVPADDVDVDIGNLVTIGEATGIVFFFAATPAAVVVVIFLGIFVGNDNFPFGANGVFDIVEEAAGVLNAFL